MAIQLSDHFTYKRLLKFCLSPIIMMIFTSVYSVVDGFFVSNFVGKVPFAALNLVMPFVMILGGVGFMMGTGGSALTAAALGSGDKERANRYFSMIVMFTVILGVILSVIGIVFMKPIARFLGATDSMLPDCVLYGRIVIGFIPAFMLQNVFQTFLVAAEKPKLGLAAIVAAGVTNIILDALFVGVLRWGIAGAAVATGIGECIGGILPMIYFIRPNSSLLQLKKTRFEAKILLRACTNGSSELMNSISSSIVSMLYNHQLLRFAGENGVAAYGTIMYIQFIFIALFVGFTIGTAPIISYNYGAENRDELKNLLKKSFVFTSIAGISMMIMAQLLAYPLSKLFVGYDPELFDMTKHAFRLFSFAFILAGMNIFTSSFFTALGNGAVSAAISFLRTLVFQTLSVMILPIIFGLDGIWWAITSAEIFAFIISLFFLKLNAKKYGYTQLYKLRQNKLS